MTEADELDANRYLARAFQPAAQDEDEITMMVRLLDLQDAAPPIRRLRDWALAAVAPQAGEVVVDVGSGTGTMAAEFAQLVDLDGRVVGIEPNPRLREIAVQRNAGRESVSFVNGLAEHLPVADATVDLVWCERVLQHLNDPQAAIAEFARVLRPGGRAMLIDSDHATRVTSDLDVEVEAVLSQAFMDQTPNPRAARNVPRQAIAAGLTVGEDIGSAGLVMPLSVMRSGQWISMVSEQAVRAGTLSRAEASRALQATIAAAEAGYSFCSVTVFGFLVSKPF